MAYYSAPAMDAGALDGLYQLLAIGQHFVAFDFETTGLSPASDRVVEIGAVRFVLREQGEQWLPEVLGTYHTLVHPGRSIPAAASAVHGIYDLDIAGEPAFSNVAAEFFTFLDGAVLLAHNAPFDCGFLQAEAARAGLAVPANPVYDTIALARAARPRLPSYSLRNLAAGFGIRQSKAHSGDDDAKVCMEIFGRCVRLLYG